MTTLMINRKSIRTPIICIALVFVLAGCGRTLIGGAVGAGATLGGYELNFKRQIDRIDQDLSSGAINQQEYDIRRDQIGRDSLLQ